MCVDVREERGMWFLWRMAEGGGKSAEKGGMVRQLGLCDGEEEGDGGATGYVQVLPCPPLVRAWSE